MSRPDGKPTPWWKTVPEGAKRAPPPGQPWQKPPVPATPGPPQLTQPTVRQPGSAPPLLLAHAWDGVLDPSGWWISEKLDGIRAYWNGSEFVSRLGNTFVAPEWFAAALPKLTLDGELWAGRKRFQRAVSIVRRQDASDDWKEIVFVVFDAPATAGTFEDRLAVAGDALVGGAAHVRVHTHERCRDIAHLREELDRVEREGGEGLMMRRPGSRYEIGRSRTLLKVKTFRDAEAVVVGHLPGAGKHKGRLGALLVEMPDGKRFSVGTGLSDEERLHPPDLGTVITYRYQELSDGGVPRFPSFVGIRIDMAPPR